MFLKNKYIALAIVTSLALPSYAVTPKTSAPAPKAPSVINRITEGYEDFVEIELPDSFLNQLVKEMKASTTTPKKEEKPKQQSTVKPGVSKVDGFRIQVFGDGTNQSTLEARARARGNAIVAKFPKYRGQVYSYSSSPNWYTRVGNFRDQKEASAALSELKRAFPQFAGDMRVVKSQITVIR